ncbi:unnamed protein product [Ixodes pacificus]
MVLRERSDREVAGIISPFSAASVMSSVETKTDINGSLFKKNNCFFVWGEPHFWICPMLCCALQSLCGFIFRVSKIMCSIKTKIEEYIHTHWAITTTMIFNLHCYRWHTKVSPD